MLWIVWKLKYYKHDFFFSFNLFNKQKITFLNLFFYFQQKHIKTVKKVNNKFFNEFFIKINHKKLYSFDLNGFLNISKCKWANLKSSISLNYWIYSIDIHEIYFYY